MYAGLMECDQEGGSKGWVRGGVGPALCKMRQLTCSMGPERTGTRIHATKATKPSKDFAFKILSLILCTVHSSPFISLKTRKYQDTLSSQYTNAHTVATELFQNFLYPDKHSNPFLLLRNSC
jgi:hypothetical protein